jgi:hypothetical protein
MIQEYEIEAECPDSTCWYDINVEVTWVIADFSFDHEFGTYVEYGYELDSTMIYKFTAYDDDGEIIDQFNIEDVREGKDYTKDKIYKKHIKKVQQLVDDYFRNIEPPEVTGE